MNVNNLSDEIILELYELKTFAECMTGHPAHCGKRRKCWLLTFSIFSNTGMISRSFIPRIVKINPYPAVRDHGLILRRV